MPLLDPGMEPLLATKSHQQSKPTNFTIAAIMSGLKDRQQATASLAATIIKDKLDLIKREPEEDDIEEEEDRLRMTTNSNSSGTDERVLQPKKERRCRVVEQSNCPDLDGVKCCLENKELWDKFCEFGTEMIITRTGRRMFPTVRCSFAGLDNEPGIKYLVLLDIVPCDNKRYRYAYHRSAWLVAGKADPPPPHRLYAHPDGPFTPEQIRKQVISFEKVKVTNNETDNTGQVITVSSLRCMFSKLNYLVLSY
jgi:hypothetical protein